MKTTEQIQENYEKYFKLISKYFGHEVSKRLEDTLGKRLAIAPRGLTLEEGGYPGALIEFALRTAKKTTIVASEVDQKSLLRVILVHSLGMLGDENEDQMISQDSQWHQEKLGQYYKYNDKCGKMSYTHRTLYFLSKLGFEFNTDEWIAIITSGGFHLEENRFYARDGHVLSHMLQACKCLAENELKASAKSSN
jgi:hypothetical protein